MADEILAQYIPELPTETPAGTDWMVAQGDGDTYKTPINAAVAASAAMKAAEAGIAANTAAISTLNSNLATTTVELEYGNISSSSGTVLSRSIIRIVYNKYMVGVSYYIRLQDSTGRPTITISGLPSGLKSFSGNGAPTYARAGTTNYITDNSWVSHAANSTQMTLSFYNFIGDFPSGSGWVVASGGFVG